jgi:hypothetical protein
MLVGVLSFRKREEARQEAFLQLKVGNTSEGTTITVAKGILSLGFS